jgi:KDO2-lipid IV(A) lauroyltransferase
MTVLFRLLSRAPLWLLHGLGWALGWLVFLASGTYRRRFRENAGRGGVCAADRRTAVGEAGKMLMELPRLWLGRPVPVRWEGEAHVADALQAQRGVLFLTPHLGCFEVAAQAYASQFGCHGHPMTVLFRPPRKAWLRALVAVARVRPGLAVAPTTRAGVRQLLQSLRAGHCVGLLPDQVPPRAMGLWAPFFGQAAYTMTLSARLALQTGAVLLLAWAERLPRGQGYVVHVLPMDAALSPALPQALAQINRAMESLIQRHPAQYLWGYARYKSPAEEAT